MRQKKQKDKVKSDKKNSVKKVKEIGGRRDRSQLDMVIGKKTVVVLTFNTWIHDD